MQGFLKTALVVGSFHMLDRLGEEGPERVVRCPHCALGAWGMLVALPVAYMQPKD